MDIWDVNSYACKESFISWECTLAPPDQYDWMFSCNRFRTTVNRSWTAHTQATMNIGLLADDLVMCHTKVTLPVKKICPAVWPFVKILWLFVVINTWIHIEDHLDIIRIYRCSMLKANCFVCYSGSSASVTDWYSTAEQPDWIDVTAGVFNARPVHWQDGYFETNFYVLQCKKNSISVDVAVCEEWILCFSIILHVEIYTVPRKRRYYCTFVSNFAKCWPT